MLSEDLKTIGCINQNFNSAGRTTCGFGLFISNILSHLLINANTEDTTGIVVYSEYGKGSCFCLKMKNDLGPGKLDLGSSKSDFLGSVSTFHEINKLDGKKKKGNLSAELKNAVSKKDFDKKSMLNSIKIEKVLSNPSLGKGSISNRSIITKKMIFEQTHGRRNFSFLSNLSSQCQCQCPRILIVDDAPFNIEVCKNLISKRNIPNESANNGLEALVLIENILENRIENKFCSKCRFYKLILMDIDMPMKNGIETTELIKNLLNGSRFNVRIVGLSAFNQEDIKRKGLKAGMCEYIEKPINFKKMNDIINKYVL